jgi:Fructose-2,6-bisphosphatase
MFLVRHGATTLSAEDRFAGSIEVPLSDDGRNQASRLANRLAAQPIAAIYSSPLGRTMETARILAEPHGCEIRQEPDLREISHGHWEGRNREEVEKDDPDEYARWEDDPFNFAPGGGETGLAVTARALPTVLRIIETHRDQHVLVVSHKATIRLILSALLGFDPRAYRDRLDQGPAALNVLDFRDLTHARLTLFNDTSHYCAASGIPPIPTHRLSRWWDPPETK